MVDQSDGTYDFSIINTLLPTINEIYKAEVTAKQWTWVVRALAAISEHAGDLQRESLEELAGRMEHGVKHTESVELLRRRCPLDRAKLDSVVGVFLSEMAEPEAELAEFRDWFDVHGERMVGLRVGYFAGIAVDEDDVELLAEFLEV